MQDATVIEQMAIPKEAYTGEAAGLFDFLAKVQYICFFVAKNTHVCARGLPCLEPCALLIPNMRGLIPSVFSPLAPM